jgi:NADH dehydrogenase
MPRNPVSGKRSHGVLTTDVSALTIARRACQHARMSGDRHRVVVVGGGFGGTRVVEGLAGAEVDVTLVDRRNFHLFQPLSYQVATGALAPGDVTYPLRALFKDDAHVRVVLGEVSGFDVGARQVLLDVDAAGVHPAPIGYDTLVVAAGSTYSYFGHDEWAAVAGEVKSLESALAVRSRLLAAFERAELDGDPEARRAALTFVVVGAGTTGVEMAGQIAELARDTLRHDFRSIDSRQARVLLVEGADRVLGTFPPVLSGKAESALRGLGVTPMLGRLVTDVRPGEVVLTAADGTTETLRAGTVVWAAGVQASGLAATLAAATGAQTDRAGRIVVRPDLTVPGHPEITALGDMVRIGDSRPLGVAPVAIQQGHYVAKRIRRTLEGRPARPFRYINKGNLATIGRGQAVADFGRGGLRLSGLPAWVLWLTVHLFYLVGLQNRAVVFLRWSFAYLTRGRGSRIIGPDALPAPGRAGDAGADHL